MLREEANLKNYSTTETMRVTDNSTGRPRARFHLKRRCFHRVSLWPWILVIVVPLLVRLVMFYDIAFLFQSSSSFAVMKRPEELQLYSYPRKNLESPPDTDDVNFPVINYSEAIRPDEDVWITHDDWISHATDQLKNEPSPKHKRTEEARSTVLHLPVTKLPSDQDIDAVNFRFPKGNEEDNRDVGEEGKLRKIGERMETIKKLAGQRVNAEETKKSTLIDDDDRRANEQERGTDQRQFEVSQGNDEKKGIQERRAEDERDEGEANEERKAAEEGEEGTGEEMRNDEDRRIAVESKASDERKSIEGRETADKRILAEEKLANLDRSGEDTGADEERRIANQLEAAPEKMVVEELEVAHGKKGVGEWESEDERKIARGKEADVDRRNAEERQAEEKMMIAKDREADQERKVPEEEREVVEEREGLERKSADDRNAAQEKEVEEERNAGEQGEAAEETKGEEKKPATDRTEAEEQRDRTDTEEENSDDVEEQKTADGQKEAEKTVRVQEAAQETTRTDDQNQKEEEEEKQEESDPKYREDFTTPSDQTRGASRAGGECDLFEGDWEYDPEGPLYTNSTCFYIRGDHDCMSNGRQDTSFLNWRWKPRGCDLPRFDARAFLEAFKGKTKGFVGDSLARNQMQSMLCMLSMVEVPINLHEDALSVRWFYELYRVTLVAVWSPYLLKESQDGIMGFEKGRSVLYLDVLDPVWTSMLPDFDVIVLSVGQWYFKPSVYIMQDEVIGCHYCPNLNLTEVGFVPRYSEGLRLALERVAADWKGIAILSTFASAHGERRKPDEFEQCSRERPLEQEEYENSFRKMHEEMRDIVWGEFGRMVNDENKENNDVHIEFLDVSNLSSLRADGHPGPFVNANPFDGKNPDELVFNDCLHWCLPGPVDTWNQLLVKIADKHL